MFKKNSIICVCVFFLLVIAASLFGEFMPSGRELKVNILDHNVSSSPGTTTSVSGTLSSGATTATVSSCNTFNAPGYGIGIAAAGAAGAYFTGTIVSCSGTTLTWTPATSTTVSSPTINHDETAAIQALLTAAPTKPTLLYIPNVGSCYKVSSMLTFAVGANTNVYPFSIVGDESGTSLSTSCLTAMSSSMTAILHIGAWDGSYIQHIGFNTNSLTNVGGLWIDSLNDTLTASATYQDYVDDVMFGGMAGANSFGIHYAHSCSSTPQVSEQSVSNSKFYGDQSTAGYGILIDCGGNVKNFTFSHNVIDGFVTAGIDFVGQNTSSLQSDHDEYLNNAVDIVVGTAGSLIVNGGESESSKAFISFGCGGCTVPGTLKVDGFVWIGATVSNDFIMGVSGPTSVLLTNNQFENLRTGTSIPQISIEPRSTQANPSSLFSQGNFYYRATNASGKTPFYNVTNNIIDNDIYNGYLNGIPLMFTTINDFGGVPGAYVPITPYYAAGLVNFSELRTPGSCSSSASPAVCGSYASGNVVIATGVTTVVVDTTKVTPNSQIFLTFDSSLGTKLGVTCNTTEPAGFGVSARVTLTSFTIEAVAAPVTNPACFSYFIVN